MKLLRAGKSPKEIAWQLQLEWDDIKKLLSRHRSLHQIYVETYAIRYPHKDTPPPKLIRQYLAQA